MRLNTLLICFLSTGLISQAKDLGIISTVLEIKERSLIEVIQDKLDKMTQDGSLAQHQETIQKRAVARVERPAPVAEIKKAVAYSSKVFNPSIVIQEDIQDHEGRLIAKKGDVYNPLDQASFGEPLLFLDGDDETQVLWALKQKGKKVLVNGAPLALARHYKQTFYFDQGGRLVEKLGIKEVPARVGQKDKELLIEFINLVDKGNQK